MTTIRIHTLTIVTPENRFDYKFGPGINLITGEIGSGKSSMLELIKYALGGDADLRPAIVAGVRRVVLDATLGETRQRYSRAIEHKDSHTVEVIDLDGTQVAEVSVNPRKTMERAAEYLVRLVEWPQLTIASQSGKTTGAALTFFDLYRYMYVQQTEIDRSVVGHLDTFLAPKRKAAFELLLDLTTERLEALRVDTRKAEKRLSEESAKLRPVDEFLKRTGVPSEEALLRKHEAAQAAAVERRAEITLARTDAAEAARSVEQTRLSLAEANENLAAASSRARVLDGELSERLRLAETVRAALSRLDRATDAAKLLIPLRFERCPRCSQQLDENRAKEGACFVCLLPEPTERSEALDAPDEFRQKEQARLAALEGEIAELSAEVATERMEIDEIRREAEREIDRLEGSLADYSSTSLQPALERLQLATSELAIAERTSVHVSDQLKLWKERSLLHEPVIKIETDLESLQSEVVAAEEELRARRSERLEELSSLFDEVIQALQMPWYEEGARIDSTSYLPVVNGVDIKKLGSGGMKMMSTVAYHLAILTYGLANRIATVPDLLIIDSPRKNLGSGLEDQEHATAFYRWLAAITAEYADRFQIIICDNDDPPFDLEVAYHHRLSHDRPLIRDLEHPGEVETIGND